MLNNRRKDSTFLKVENGKIIELDESKKENWENIQNQKDNEIKQQTYKKRQEKEIEAEPNKSKRIIKKNSTLLLRIALALIFLPLIIILCLYLYTSFSGANTKLTENVNETTVRSIQEPVEETRVTQNEVQEPVEIEETSNSITIKKQPLSDMKLNNILVSIDKYNETIYSVFSDTKVNVSDVVYHYGDVLLAEDEIAEYYEKLNNSYSTFTSDELLHTEAPNMYLIMEQRYNNAFDMINDLANNLDMSGETVLNNYITTNNNLLEDQVQAELVFLDNNNIKYEVNGLNVEIKGN